MPEVGQIRSAYDRHVLRIVRFLAAVSICGCVAADGGGFLDGFDTPRPSPTPLAPLGLPDSYDANVDATLVVDAANGVLSNDVYDGEGTLAAFLAALATNGAINLQENGSFSYTPATGFAGVDSFQYVASDGDVTSSPTLVTIDVGSAVSPGR